MRLNPAGFRIRRKLKGCSVMGRRRQGIMSDEFKYELAKDLGFYDTVKNEGWGAIRSRDAGNMVKRAIELAEQHLSSQNKS
jgi:small acid-soluble spore protein F (minor alpha/beta-type SASP)